MVWSRWILTCSVNSSDRNLFSTEAPPIDHQGDMQQCQVQLKGVNREMVLKRQMKRNPKVSSSCRPRLWYWGGNRCIWLFFFVCRQMKMIRTNQLNCQRAPLSQINTPGVVLSRPSSSKKLLKESSMVICRLIRWVSYWRSFARGPSIPNQKWNRNKICKNK